MLYSICSCGEYQILRGQELRDFRSWDLKASSVGSSKSLFLRVHVPIAYIFVPKVLMEI